MLGLQRILKAQINTKFLLSLKIVFSLNVSKIRTNLKY